MLSVLKTILRNDIEENKKMEGLSIRKIIDKITSGEIRIPSFQRGFVWEEDDVAFFIDSLFKGYPIGAVLLWRTKANRPRSA